MANIATLTVNLKTETAEFSAGLKKSKRQADSFANDVKKALGSIAVVGIATAAIKSIAEAGLQMEKLTRGLKAATGSGEAAAREFAFMRDEALRLGLDLSTAGASFTKLAAAARGTVLEGQGARDIFTAISEASVVLGLSAEQTGGALTAIEQIISKGKVSAEELRGQLGERLPGAFQIAARSIGVTTSELDEMLKAGKLTAEDLLPNLARELRATFGPEVEDAAGSAQAAFNRMSTSIFELKAAIAESGVLDALAGLADKIRFAIGGQTVTEEIEQYANQLRSLLEAGRSLEDNLVTGTVTKLIELNEQLAETERRLANVRKSPNRAFVSFASANAELDKLFKKQDEDTKRAFDSFVASFETAEQEVARKLAELDLFKNLLPPEEFARIREEIVSTLTEGIEEIDLKGLKKMRASFMRTTEEMTEFARQAARNIQDAFADFFFDPFEGGLSGLLKSFVDVIRRMVANLLASKLLQYLATLPGPFGKFFKLGTGNTPSTGPPAALGGLRRNQPFIAGERGPELVSPGGVSSVSAIGHTFVFGDNIINGGGNMSPATLIPLLEQNNRKLKAEFVDELRRGAFS